MTFKKHSLLILLSAVCAEFAQSAKLRSQLRQVDAQQTDSARSSDPAKQMCLDSLAKIFNSDTLNGGDPYSLFNAYVSDFCSMQPLDVPNAVKASTCFYSGYFVLKYMQSKRGSPDAIETLKIDYCNKYPSTLPKRTTFISALKAAAESEFQQVCQTELQTRTGLNEWFDPIDPMVSISQQEVCDIHQKLFASLKQKGISSLAEYVSFSYIVTLDLFLNANQQEDYESCINTQVISAPKQQCLDYIANHAVFSLWSPNLKSEQCSQVETAVATSCEGAQQCDGCAVSLARLYQNYSQFANQKYSDYFQQYEKSIFASLEAENKRAASS